MSLSTVDLPLNWMPKGASDAAADNLHDRSQSYHGAVADGDDRETGTQLPAVAVTVGLTHMHHLQGCAGCCQRTMLACRTWNAVCVVRTAPLAATNLGAVRGGPLHVWFEHRWVEVESAVH